MWSKVVRKGRKWLTRPYRNGPAERHSEVSLFSDHDGARGLVPQTRCKLYSESGMKASVSRKPANADGREGAPEGACGLQARGGRPVFRREVLRDQQERQGRTGLSDGGMGEGGA